MSAPLLEAPRVLREMPGRVRVHLPGWGGADPGLVERAAGGLPGVHEASARGSTGNLLIRFDPCATDTQGLLRGLGERLGGGFSKTEPPSPDAPGPRPAAAEPRPAADVRVRPTSVLRERAGRLRRVRIAVPGLDRDPRLARRVVEALERRPDVRRAAASVTTGRVLVEFSGRYTSLQDVLAELSSLDLPDVPEGDRPTHPLDPAPIVQSGVRVAGAALGLAAVGLGRVLGSPVAAAAPAGVVAGAIGILDGSPPARAGLSRALGRDRARMLLSGGAIVSLTLSGSPLGLLVTGAGALRVFTEARLRRRSWREYEQRVAGAPTAQPGAVARLETGARVPLRAHVLEGEGTVIGADGLPDGVTPGAWLSAGARVLRGPLVVELVGDRSWQGRPRPCPPRPDALDRYLRLMAPAGTVYAVALALLRRSPSALFTGLLLVNARPALIGTEAADTGASARLLRAGVTVVGTRPERGIRLPDTLIVDGPRVLTDGLELSQIVPAPGLDREAISSLVGAMISASGAPWGAGAQLPGASAPASEARFDGRGVSAIVGGRQLRLELATTEDRDDEGVVRGRDAGEEVLMLRETGDRRLLACVRLRPRLAPGLDRLRDRCRAAGTQIVVLERDDRRASRTVARRAQLPLVVEADLTELVRERQQAGERVAVLSDSPTAAEAFEACDLAIGLSSGRSSHFQARADLLAPGLAAVVAVIGAAHRREQAAGTSVACSVAANLAGAVWGLQGDPGLVRASQATYLGALCALGNDWVRLHGGRRARSIVNRLTDPRPERWGAVSAREALAAVGGSPEGLTTGEAAARHQARPGPSGRNSLLAALGQQLESPLMVVLGGGAVLSLAVGAVADVAIIGAVIGANAAVGAWQERQAGRAAAALHRMGAASGRVLRDGEVVEVPADDIVTGDILLVGSGDRIVADARLLEAEALEVDEASLTGESLPVAKSCADGSAAARVLLEGSDVTVGTGRAVVMAVGRETRLGATAAALEVEESAESPLGRRLDRLFRRGLPLVAAGGALVTAAGIAWGGAPLAQLAIGASVAIAAVPEGLPLLAGVAEAAVARRLAARSALVRRLSSVEALGRVDVACCDKTGTLTQGNLAVTLVDDLDCTTTVGASLAGSASDVLCVAGLASPASDSPDAWAHPTDAAVLQAVAAAGLEPKLRAERTGEVPFDPTRALHATATKDRVAIKGATEALINRCSKVRAGSEPPRVLGSAEREELLARAEALSARGLRVLMVAEGPAEVSVEDPAGLTALGFVGITDPLRPGVAEAVARCQRAGIRLVMLTGDHPATARAIAREAGLPSGEECVVTGDEISALENGELRRRLEGVSVVARITPVDKLRIVDSLKRAGHTVAMTGDGVNDAPALRLADVGVAMGAGGTEVARQAADVIIADDRFETLTDALLEGRSLWRHLHHALGLLLGGNLGEVLLMAGAAILGRSPVLGARQVLAVNLVTDVLPAVAVAVQAPRERELHEIAAEGAESFDQRLRSDILRRGVATAAPALVATLAAPLLGAAPQVVAFASIIITQLAQTLQAGQRESQLSRPVLGAVGASAGVLAVSLWAPPLRRFLALPAAGPVELGLALVTGPAAVAVASLWEADRA